MTQEHSCHPSFLALTALEEFWDKSQFILFLGPWCQPLDKISVDEKINATVLEHPDLVDNSLHQAYHYTFQIYEKLLHQIANWLNRIHGVHLSLNYWRIVIGPFLLLYIQVTYHRWMALKIAISSYSNLNTIGLAKTSYITPINSHEFALFAAESDTWNHQLMTQILDLMSFDVKSYQAYEWSDEVKQRQLLYGTTTSYKKITRIKIKLITFLARMRRLNVVGMCGAGGALGTKEDVLKAVLLSQFTILPILESRAIERAAIEQSTLNMSIRESLSKLMVQDEFSRIVLETLKVNLPIIFVEHYQEEMQKSIRCFPFSPRVILGGWILNDRMAMWAAKLAEQGSMLISIQHGGVYGMLNFTTYEELEKANSDIFISWGWKAINSNVLPAPSVYICKRKEMKERANYINQSNFILWVTTDRMRYSVHLSSVSVSCHEYLSWQEQFLANVKSTILDQIIIRLPPTSKLHTFLQKRWSSLNIQSPNGKGSFFEQLNNAKIVIVDNANTTFLYALAFNIPTILFWDKLAWEMREEAKPYFSALQEVGIYHDSPKSAAEMLNKVFDNPSYWWSNAALQSARQEFCNNYAKISPNWLRDWVNLLANLLKKRDALAPKYT